MHVTRLPSQPLSASAVTIGSFDGVHRGHQQIIQRLTDYARAHALRSVVVTFEPQPREFLTPDQAPARLSSLSDKVRRLAAMNVDQLVVLPFNARLRSLSADAFVQHVLIDRLNTQWLQVGDDFRFGADRKGDSQFLQSYNFKVVELATQRADDGARISSTRIRNALQQSEFNLAEQMLGEPYSLTGRVVYGRQLGRTIGVPTANLLLAHKKLPTEGVFAVTAELQGKTLHGVANLGPKPTVQDARHWLETHFFEYTGMLYGKRITVQLHQRLRGIESFDTLDNLKQQIQQDIEAARTYFRNQWK